MIMVQLTIPDPKVHVYDQARLHRYMDVAVQHMAGFAEREVMLATPGSGVVRALWTTTYTRGKDGRITEAIIHNTFDDPKELILWLEGGTRAHDIFPKPDNPRGLMIFYWEAVGKVVGARHVRHPGTRPYRMVETGYLNLTTNMHIFKTAFEQSVQAMLDNTKK